MENSKKETKYVTRIMMLITAVARLFRNDDTSFAKYVYLERLVRQDETGIWTVVGYDKAK